MHALSPPRSSIVLRLAATVVSAAAILLTTGCRTTSPGAFVSRAGDEIMVAGQMVHTGTPVVLWTDPGGYDAYRVERRFGPYAQSSWRESSAQTRSLTTPNRYGLREDKLTPEELQRVRGGGWDLPLLQQTIDQFVLHFDVCGTSRQCFKVLQDERDLSVHFMLDLDGTIYQTLDVKERAWHATKSNSRSVGVEIANMGAYPPGDLRTLDQWYQSDGQGGTRITIPQAFGDGGVRTPGFIGHPARPQPVKGRVQNQDLVQYDFTPEQYHALMRLTATLCTVLPKIRCDYPRDPAGNVVPNKLPDDQLAAYQGVLGHYHIQTNKTDPGPALQWDYLINGARALMTPATLPAGRRVD